MASILEILTCARRLVNQGRWTQGTVEVKRTMLNGKVEGAYCLVGLVGKCMRGDAWLYDHRTAECQDLPASRFLAKALADFPPIVNAGWVREDDDGSTRASIVNWNDDPGTDADDVLAALDHAIRKAEKEGVPADG